MPAADDEIIVEDPTEPAEDSPPVTTVRTVEIAVYLLLILLAFILGLDNWRVGNGWASNGPQAGYFPFYLCLVLAAACLYGLATVLPRRAGTGGTFVTRDQLRRVMQVFVPTLLFCILTQWLGLYVASFLLISIFMRLVGRIAWWKSLLTAAVFSVVMFVTFEIAFDVLMPKGPLEDLLGY